MSFQERIKKAACAAAALVLTASIAGCGKGDEPAAVRNDNAIDAKYSSLEDGIVYIEHASDGTFEQLYFPYSTFSRWESPSRPSNSRVMWFKDDYSKIPNLYLGDRLIYFSKHSFSESFTFERFEDFGYTIGMCGLGTLGSGRYTISTDLDAMCTFPESDADQLMRFDTNSYLVLDKLGEKDIRSTDQNGEDTGFLTRIGTIKGLTKGARYPTEIYSGTEYLQNMTFCADVRAFGSMEVFSTDDYVFDRDKNIIIIPIPQFFNVGYYSVNGQGIFRLVNGTSYSEDMAINHNQPNVVPDDEAGGYVGIQEGSDRYYTDPGNAASALEDVVERSFEIKQTGNITIEVGLKLKDAYRDDAALTQPWGTVTYPDGNTRKSLHTNDQGSLVLDINADQLGKYFVRVYELGPREVELKVVPKEG